jgi:cell division protein FtsQ
MDRSFAARSPIGRPAAPRAPRRAGRSSTDRGRARFGQTGLWWPFSTVARLTRACFSFAWRRRRLRIALLSVLTALPLLAGGWLWLRDSSLVSVERVQVSGVHGPEARAIKAALAEAARHMSTLDVQPRALRAAVASFPVVREVRASPSFPHGLRIRVVEQLPVAVLTVGGARTAVAADGVVLGPALLSSSLAVVSDSASAALTGQRVRGAYLLADLTVLGAAPAPLARVVRRVYTGPEGLTVVMRNGLLAYFGDGTLPHAKWLSLARVLADPSSAGAVYVDLRLPERPAAGFAAGTSPTGATAPETGAATGGSPTNAEPGSASEPATAAALAAGLTAAVGGRSPTGSPTGHEAASTGTTPTETTSTAPSVQAAAAAPAETTPAPVAEAPAATSTPGG